ncbi:hypothetical protein KAU11_07730 [Candidatus Babeliales bacterium]|nr:hypothetical protein [Candidatus Babeliales bacterium]
MGVSRKKPLWSSLDVDVLTSETKDIDSVLLSAFKGSIFVITATGNGLTKNLTLQSSKNNSSVSDMVYNRWGDSLSITFDFISSGGNAFIRSTNSESFTINLSIKKLTF